MTRQYDTIIKILAEADNNTNERMFTYMLSFRETKIYRELDRRKTDNSQKYIGALISICSDMGEFLQYIKCFFSEYPDHGLQHSTRIIYYISEILTDDEMQGMSDTEIFCLIMSALFHDSGMVIKNAGDKDNVRKEHHEFAGNVIDKYFEQRLKIFDNAERLKAVIKFVCRAHGRNIEDIYGDKNFGKTDKIDYDEVRYSLLAVMLRIGDLMDLENQRVNPFVLYSFSSTFPQNSLDHNLRHTQINFYNYNSNEIKGEVRADNINQFKIWSVWIKYLKEEILRSNSYFKKYNFFFPVPEIEIVKSADADFDVKEIHFEIDEGGGMWNIISQSIYTDRFDFVREILQNAVDASLISIYNNKEITLLNASPRSWNAGKYSKDIIVGHSETKNELIVVDYGVGMNISDLYNFLFKVSSSGYADAKIRNFDFPGVAKFGIGFISCLVNINKINIYTKKEDESKIHHVSLESNSNLAFIQDKECNDFSGTAIVMNLKQKFSYNELSAYILSAFKFPSIGIRVIDIDKLQEVCHETIFQLDSYKSDVKPYMLDSIFLHANKKTKEYIEPYLKEYGMIKDIYSQYINICELYKDAKAEIERTVYQKRIKKIKKAALALEGQFCISNIKVPAQAEFIDEKNKFFIEEYFQALEGASEKLDDEIKKLDKVIEKYQIKDFHIKSATVSMGHDWKYAIIILSNKLELVDIMFTNKAVDLSDKTGIVLMYTEEHVYNMGVELAVINGFLFKDGEICDTIAHLTRYTEKEVYRDRDKESVIFGTNRDFYDIYDDLEMEYMAKVYEGDSEGYSYVSCDDELVVEFDKEYDVLTVHENRFKYYTGLDLMQSNHDAYSIDDVWLTASEQKEYNTVHMLSDVYDTDTQVKLGEFCQAVEGKQTVFCQDGIEIPYDLTSLIPFGFFRIICNCTADSRMKLNVTRHKPSEIQQDVDEWIINTGSKIQRLIFDSVNSKIKKLNLCVNYNEIKYRNNKSSFDSENRRNIRRLSNMKR